MSSPLAKLLEIQDLNLYSDTEIIASPPGAVVINSGLINAMTIEAAFDPGKQPIITSPQISRFNAYRLIYQQQHGIHNHPLFKQIEMKILPAQFFFSQKNVRWNSKSPTGSATRKTSLSVRPNSKKPNSLFLDRFWPVSPLPPKHSHFLPPFGESTTDDNLTSNASQITNSGINTTPNRVNQLGSVPLPPWPNVSHYLYPVANSNKQMKSSPMILRPCVDYYIVIDFECTCVVRETDIGGASLNINMEGKTEGSRGDEVKLDENGGDNDKSGGVDDDCEAGSDDTCPRSSHNSSSNKLHLKKPSKGKKGKRGFQAPKPDPKHPKNNNHTNILQNNVPNSSAPFSDQSNKFETTSENARILAEIINQLETDANSEVAITKSNINDGKIAPNTRQVNDHIQINPNNPPPLTNLPEMSPNSTISPENPIDTPKHDSQNTNKQVSPNPPQNSTPKFEKFIQEIIEFPALLINSHDLTIVSVFHSYVKPTINPILSQFCKDLTHISQDQVDQAPTIDVVMVLFINWLVSYGVIMHSSGLEYLQVLTRFKHQNLPQISLPSNPFLPALPNLKRDIILDLLVNGDGNFDIDSDRNTAYINYNKLAEFQYLVNHTDIVKVLPSCSDSGSLGGTGMEVFGESCENNPDLKKKKSRYGLMPLSEQINIARRLLECNAFSERNQMNGGNNEKDQDTITAFEYFSKSLVLMQDLLHGTLLDDNPLDNSLTHRSPPSFNDLSDSILTKYSKSTHIVNSLIAPHYKNHFDDLSPQLEPDLNTGLFVSDGPVDFLGFLIPELQAKDLSWLLVYLFGINSIGKLDAVEGDSLGKEKSESKDCGAGNKVKSSPNNPENSAQTPTKNREVRSPEANNPFLSQIYDIHKELSTELETSQEKMRNKLILADNFHNAQVASSFNNFTFFKDLKKTHIVSSQLYYSNIRHIFYLLSFMSQNYKDCLPFVSNQVHTTTIPKPSLPIPHSSTPLPTAPSPPSPHPLPFPLPPLQSYQSESVIGANLPTDENIPFLTNLDKKNHLLILKPQLNPQSYEKYVELIDTPDQLSQNMGVFRTDERNSTPGAQHETEPQYYKLIHTYNTQPKSEIKPPEVSRSTTAGEDVKMPVNSYLFQQNTMTPFKYVIPRYSAPNTAVKPNPSSSGQGTVAAGGGLPTFLKLLNMKFIGKLHCGLNDSLNISRLLYHVCFISDYPIGYTGIGDI